MVKGEEAEKDAQQLNAGYSGGFPGGAEGAAAPPGSSAELNWGAILGFFGMYECIITFLYCLLG